MHFPTLLKKQIPSSPPSKVMVVGQVPPPWGGQAVMIKKLIDSNLTGVELHFVPMKFSADMDEIGRFRWAKIIRLPHLVCRIWIERFKHRCNILYYPPGGESLTSILRDIVVLFSCRCIFKKTIFHVHAGGFTEVVDAAPFIIRRLAYVAYRKPDLVIHLTERSPPDGIRINAHRIVNVPNGLSDEAEPYLRRCKPKECQSLNLLFVGVVSPSKGIMVLLKACDRLAKNKIDFSLKIMGRFYSPEFETKCRNFVEKKGLASFVNFIGVKVGEEKLKVFSKSDIFCFPSHFESENQSLVILEAMQFGLPCVASDWRGMSTMIVEGETGYLIPIKDDAKLAEKIDLLASSPELVKKMSVRARDKYLKCYTEDIWRKNMSESLRSILIFRE